MATIRECAADELAALLPLVREFHAAESLPFDGRTHQALAKLLANPELGRVWLAEENSPAPGIVAGYLVLGFGFGLEYQGQDAIVDEVFVRPELRGRGIARALVEHALDFCKQRGISAVHLEVDQENDLGQRLYQSLGFARCRRDFLTRWL